MNSFGIDECRGGRPIPAWDTFLMVEAALNAANDAQPFDPMAHASSAWANNPTTSE